MKKFMNNVIEMKKEEFKQKIGSTHKIENMVEDFKKLNLTEEKLAEVIKVAKKYI